MNTLGQWDPVLLKSQNVLFQEKRDEQEKVYEKFTRKGDSSEADYRSATAIREFGLMAYTPPSGDSHLDEYKMGSEAVVKFNKYTISCIWPEELPMDMADNSRTKKDKVKLFTGTASEDFAASEEWTNEVIYADFILRANSTTATRTWAGTFRDGLALASTSHVTVKGTPVTWSNLQTGSAMTQLALLEGAKMLASVPTEAGRPQGAIGDIGIIYGRYNSFRVDELLGAPTTPDVALQANPNPLNGKMEGYGKWVKILCPYLGETFTGWALIDLKNHKLLRFEKLAGKINSDVDPRNGNLIQRMIMRAACYADSAKGFLLNPGV